MTRVGPMPKNGLYWQIVQANKWAAETLFGPAPGRPTICRRGGKQIARHVFRSNDKRATDAGTRIVHSAIAFGVLALIAKTAR